MGKGSRQKVLRLPGNLDVEIVQAVNNANKAAGRQKYDVSSWIRAAIAEKLRHLKRSKKSHEVNAFPDVFPEDGLPAEEGY